MKNVLIVPNNRGNTRRMCVVLMLMLSIRNEKVTTMKWIYLILEWLGTAIGFSYAYHINLKAKSYKRKLRALLEGLETNT